MSSSRMPKQQRAEQTRRHIIETGARLFSEQGFYRTSSKKIAKEAGVSVGSFYSYFKDKKDLLLVVYQEHVQEVHQMVLAALNDPRFLAGTAGGKEIVQTVIGQTLALHKLSPAFHREMRVMRYSDPQVAEIMAREDERIVATLIEILTSGREALRVSDVAAAAHVVVTAVEEVVHSIMIFDPPLDKKRIIQALSEMIHRYLFASTTKEPTGGSHQVC